MKSARQRAAALFSSALTLLLLLATATEWTSAAAPAAPPEALRVLVLSGGDAPDGRQSTIFLRQLLQDSGRFDARICESPAGLSAATFASFDVVVEDCPEAVLGGATEKALASFVDSGKGLVVTRRGLEGQTGSSSWSRLIKAAPARDRGAGADAAFHRFTLKNVLAKHPIVMLVSRPGLDAAGTHPHGETIWL